MTLAPSFRAATPDDAVHLAHLVDLAGDGLPRYFWNQAKASEQSDWDFGAERARRESGGFSYRNGTVALIGDVVAGCTNQYMITAPSTPDDISDAPRVFHPLIELEDLAVGTFHLNVLAVYPEFRRKGIGEMLIRNAVSKSVDDQSLIVSDANITALSLYKKLGFATEARRPMIKEGWKGAGTNWILMRRSSTPEAD